MDGRLSSSRPLVSIILVSWNSAPFLPRCLDALRAQTWQPTELIVVDNASTDTSRELVKGATLIANDSNRGFSAAVNQGIAKSNGEFVLLCNPDAFLDAKYIEAIVDAMTEDVGSATGTLMREDGKTVDTAGMRMTRSGRHLDIQSFSPRGGEKVAEGRMRGRVESPSPAASRDPLPATRGEGADVTEVFGVSGAAAVYRTTFLRDVAVDGEVFDEDFFAYREDADIAWRGQLRGWRSIHVAAATGTHVRRVTPERRGELPPEINMHSVKNRFLLRLKNEGLYLALRNAPFEIARDLMVIAAVFTVERTSLPALAWLWKNRRRIVRKRSIIQQRRRVSDRALAKWFR